MGLDPQCAAVLKSLESMGLPPIDKMEVAQAREIVASFRLMMGVPEDVSMVEDRTIPGPGGEILVRIFTPDGVGPMPVLIYWHGGGFTTGSVDLVDPICRMLANRSGCVVVDAGYRLGPEHRYPAAVDDAHTTLEWVVANADDLGIDTTRLAVGGDSAGGNLAGVTALRARTRGGPAIAFQLLVYPVTDHSGDYPSFRENGEGYLLTSRLQRWCLDQYTDDPARLAEPDFCLMGVDDVSGLPPAFILTAEFDPRRDEGEAYGAKLAAAGVNTEVRRYNGQIHPFFWLPAVVDVGAQAIEDAAAALKKALV